MSDKRMTIEVDGYIVELNRCIMVDGYWSIKVRFSPNQELPKGSYVYYGPDYDGYYCAVNGTSLELYFCNRFDARRSLILYHEKKVMEYTESIRSLISLFDRGENIPAIQEIYKQIDIVSYKDDIEAINVYLNTFLNECDYFELYVPLLLKTKNWSDVLPNWNKLVDKAWKIGKHLPPSHVKFSMDIITA